MVKKKCTKCERVLPITAFSPDRGGYKKQCKACRRPVERDRMRKIDDERAERELKEQEERIKSEYAALKPEDFDVSVGNQTRTPLEAKMAAKEKRQEFNKNMGEFAQGLREVAQGGEMPAKNGKYIAELAEQERRFGNRRRARSLSLAAAQEALAVAHFKEAAERYFKDKIVPTGYALKKPTPKKRSVCLLLSDLHLGSELSSLDEPMPFGAVQEARRLEYVVRQALDYKTQYRKDSELVLLLNGDLIDGQLMHDFRDGAPLAEQKVVFWKYFQPIIGVCAQQFPSVRVICQPGNHGRDKVRHPGRATSRKWDGHETEMYYALSMMASNLKNVSWQIDHKAVSVVDLYGAKLGLTHGDTELKLSDPDTKAQQNFQVIDRVNSARVFGCEFDAWAFGHFHKGRYQPRTPRILWNGALVPPNGYARAAGYVGEPCGQWVWEAVEGYPVGDLRFIGVGPSQDNDERLGTIIKPFRFEAE